MEIKDILKPDEYEILNQVNQTDRDWLNDRIQIRRDRNGPMSRFSTS